MNNNLRQRPTQRPAGPRPMPRRRQPLAPTSVTVVATVVATPNIPINVVAAVVALVVAIPNVLVNIVTTVIPIPNAPGMNVVHPVPPPPVGAVQAMAPPPPYDNDLEAPPPYTPEA
jgi:hypothetical protein